MGPSSLPISNPGCRARVAQPELFEQRRRAPRAARGGRGPGQVGAAGRRFHLLHGRDGGMAGAPGIGFEPIVSCSDAVTLWLVLCHLARCAG